MKRIMTVFLSTVVIYSFLFSNTATFALYRIEGSKIWASQINIAQNRVGINLGSYDLKVMNKTIYAKPTTTYSYNSATMKSQAVFSNQSSTNISNARALTARVLPGIAISGAVLFGIELTIQLLKGEDLPQALKNTIPTMATYGGVTMAGLAGSVMLVKTGLIGTSQALRMLPVFGSIAFMAISVITKLASGASIPDLLTDPSFYIDSAITAGFVVSAFFPMALLVVVPAAALNIIFSFFGDSEIDKMNKAREEYVNKSLDMKYEIAMAGLKQDQE